MWAWISSLKVVIEFLKMINDLVKKLKEAKIKRVEESSEQTKIENTESAQKVEEEISKPLDQQDNDVLRDELRKRHNKG